MKLKNILLSAALVPALLGTSCSELDIEDPGQEAGLVEMTFTASGPETKTVLGDSTTVKGARIYPILWEAGETISVFDVNTTPKQDAQLVNEAEGNSTTASFRGLVATSATGYYALSPWQDIDGYEAHGLIDDDGDGTPESMEVAWCGYNQKATAFGYDPDKALLAAYTDAQSSEFTFRQVFAFVKLTVTFDCEWVSFSSNVSDDWLSAQNIIIKMVGGVPTITGKTQPTSGRGSQNNITLRCTSGKLPAGTYLIAVMPGTLEKGFTLTFETTSSLLSPSSSSSVSYSWEKSTDKSVTLQRGQILDLGSFSSEGFLGTPSGDWLGSGTSGDPYKISTLDQWTLLAERMNGDAAIYNKYRSCHFKLTTDLDCGGKRIAIVGNGQYRAFEGTFDGDGHTISNYIPSTGDGVEALFGYVRAATVENLTVKPASFNCNYKGADEFAYSPLIGVCSCLTTDAYSGKRTTIKNCHSVPYTSDTSLTLNCDDMDCYYGSMVAWVRGSLYCMGCDNSIDVTLKSTTDTWWGDYAAGGIAGRIIDYHLTNEICTFDRCRNTGRIEVLSSNDCMAGGILGGDYDHYSEDVTLRMSNCENRGRIIANVYDGTDSSDRYAGGLVGEHDSDGRYVSDDSRDPFFYNCLNAGWIQCNGAQCYCGGLTGYTYDEDSVFYSCVNVGAVTGNSITRYFGNFCGVAEGTYKNCFYSTNYVSVPGYTDAYFMFDRDPDEDDSHDCEREDIIGGATSGDNETADMNSWRSAIPSHPDASVIFESYGEGFQYASWTGKASSGNLAISF